MINEIIRKYGDFGDSVITNIHYDTFIKENYKQRLEITIICFNVENDFRHEVIKLLFEDIFDFVFIERDNISNWVSGGIYIMQNDDEIVFDFNPKDYFDYVEENPDSRFKIKCRKVSYEFLGVNE